MKSLHIFIAVLFVHTIGMSQLRTGTYTGNGAASQSITGLGAGPEVIMVIPATGGSASSEIQTWVHTASMASTEVKYCTGANSVANSFKTGFLSSVDATGFTVGSKANVSGTVYYFAVWNDDGSMTEGTVTGSTSDAVVNVGFAPGSVWLFSNNVLSPDYMKWTVSGRSNGTWRFSNGDGNWGEYSFKNFTATGFTLHPSTFGGSGIVNGSTYYYVAFKETTSSSNIGFGGGPDKVTTSNTPSFAMARHSTSHGNNTYVKTVDMPTNHSFVPRHETHVTQALRNFQADGFDVGSNGQLRSTLYHVGIEAGIVLPVKLLDFSANRVESITELRWSTAIETSNSHFILMGSHNATDWNEIAWIQGAGNSTEVLHYSHRTDAGFPYYKLVQEDFNGKQSESKILTVSLESGNPNSAFVYPTQASKKISIGGLTKEAQPFYVIQNVTGQSLMEGQLQNHSIDIESLPTGAYLVTLKGTEAVNQTLRFVKK